MCIKCADRHTYTYNNEKGHVQEFTLARLHTRTRSQVKDTVVRSQSLQQFGFCWNKSFCLI